MAGRRQRTLTMVATVAPAGCSWPQFGYDAAHSGTNRFESTLNVGNVGALVQVWSATNGPITSTPVAADGLVYVVAANSIFAYDATGTAGCSGSPKICTPLWTSASRPAFPLDSAGVAVTGGVVYAGKAGGAPGQPVGLAAFDSAGVAGCSGAPEVCAPLWTTSRGAGDRTRSRQRRDLRHRLEWDLSARRPRHRELFGCAQGLSPGVDRLRTLRGVESVVVNGRIYVGGTDGLHVFAQP